MHVMFGTCCPDGCKDGHRCPSCARPSRAEAGRARGPRPVPAHPTQRGISLPETGRTGAKNPLWLHRCAFRPYNAVACCFCHTLHCKLLTCYLAEGFCSPVMRSVTLCNLPLDHTQQQVLLSQICSSS